ncbi:hypothetical protein EOPP23_00345 [Endozoicomonas sp. OPT23]|nr:hypothetical protein [Endozoicomonas sp. OPT23]
MKILKMFSIVSWCSAVLTQGKSLKELQIIHIQVQASHIRQKNVNVAALFLSSFNSNGQG